MTEKRFSIRLANGSEQTFDSASQLASWTQSQYAFAQTPTRARKPKQRRQSQNQKRSEKSGLPLARYNRRLNGVGQG